MGVTHRPLKMIGVIVISCFISLTSCRFPLFPGRESENINQVLDSVSRLGDDMSSMMSGSSHNPRFARQAEPLMPYRFGYAVQDDIGNDFNQQEQSDGNTITGQYSVLLPDGRIQTVTYSVRPETGFVAEVTYTGEASFGPGVGGGGGGGGFGG